MKDKHKDNRKFCPKCGAVLGENIDGKPICQCDIWPVNEWYKECEKRLGNTTNIKVVK